MHMQDLLNSRQVRLSNAFRKLWTQHVVWTRAFVVSSAEELADLQFVTQRLLRNPSDFAEVLAVYYGRRKADEFKRLLNDHLLIAANLVNFAKAGDRQGYEAERVRWFQNADDIAAFLAGINPFWDRRDWQRMLYEHLELLEDEVTFRLESRYEDDVRIFDAIEDQALEMGDTMARGIINQFRIN